MSDAVSKQRTRNYLHQIRGTVFYKAGSMAASFLAIPITIGYLGTERFGVWSTLLSIMSWIVFFDLGVGNGLRNKVAELLAKNKTAEARSYIASGYTLIGLIAVAVWALVTASSFFVPWQTVFNTQAIPQSTLRLTVQIAGFFILLNFWVGLIAALLGAVQKTSLIAFGQVISNLLVLALIFVLAKTTTASIIHLAVLYGFSIVIANISLSLWFYQRNPELRPRFNLDRQYVQPLLSVGMKFFIIQLAALVLFTTDKILIIQLFGPQYVTQYEVVYKLFSLILIGHALIVAPLWSAYTDAYHREDFSWIKQMLAKQLIIFSAAVIFSLALGLLSRDLIKLWIDADFTINLGLILTMILFVIVSSWNNVFAFFLNGIGAVNVQLTTAIFAMIINIPISVFYVKNLELGVSGIVLGTTTSLLLAAIALPIQVHLMLKGK
jgi:O-antigen/teichoic acid export membrane protein